MKKNSILLVVARFNLKITEMLLDGALSAIDQNVYEVCHAWVPGSFEIAPAINYSINHYDAFVALGALIKGETDHYKYICDAVVSGMHEVSMKKPVGFGVIMTHSIESAIIRCDKNKAIDYGGSASHAALEMLKFHNKYVS